MSDHGENLQIRNDDISMKLKFNLSRFWGTFGTLRFKEKSFFKTLLGFKPYWDSKRTNAICADLPGVYTSEEILNLGTIKKFDSKYDVIDGIVIKGMRQPISYSLILDKLPGYKFFCQHKAIHYQRNNKPVWKTIPFYAEIDNHEEVNFNGETLTFILQLILM